MRNTDGNVDGNTGDANGDGNSSMYAWLCGHDVDRQYGRTGNGPGIRQQL